MDVMSSTKENKRKVIENQEAEKLFPSKKLDNKSSNVELQTKIPLPLSLKSNNSLLRQQNSSSTKANSDDKKCRRCNMIRNTQDKENNETTCSCEDGDSNCDQGDEGDTQQSMDVEGGSKCDEKHTSTEINSTYTNLENVNNSQDKISASTTNLDHSDNRADLELEIKKVQRRRSTIGKGRRASCSGRRSLYTVMPLLSLEDQISLIPRHLPKTTKLAHVLDIVMRAAVSKMLHNDPEDTKIEALKSSIIDKSEDLSRELAYKMEHITLTKESLLSLTTDTKCTPDNTSSKSDEIKRLVEVYQEGTKKYEEEYRQWKGLMRKRKEKYLLGKRDYEEAKTGAVKIEEEDVSPLPLVYREFIQNQPDYNHALQEMKSIKESCAVLVDDLNHSRQVIKNYLEVCNAQTESCYSWMENVSFSSTKSDLLGSMKQLIDCENQIV